MNAKKSGESSIFFYSLTSSEPVKRLDVIVKPHKYTTYISNNDATCIKDETKTAICDGGCGLKDTVTDVGSAGHKWNTEDTTDKEATEEALGSKSVYCSICGMIKESSSVVIPKLEPMTQPNVTTNTPSPKVMVTGTNFTDTKSKVQYKVNGNGTVEYTKVTIGKNVTKIEKKAFYNCSKLKIITIKSTKLKKKSVGANAFGKIHVKAKVKVSKAKLSAYKKLLKAKGLKGKKQKVTK